MWVIKLGGSLLGSPTLQKWLDLVHRYSDGKIIIVPGGGEFADAVRNMQKKIGFDDETAHLMALKAMDQTALTFKAMQPQLALAETDLEIAQRGWQHRGILWQPSRMVSVNSQLPATWNLTSDSIAAWLAQRLEATHLLVVKCTQPQQKNITYDALAQTGIVDKCFVEYTQNMPFQTWIINTDQIAAFENGFTPDALSSVGTLVAN